MYVNVTRRIVLNDCTKLNFVYIGGNMSMNVEDVGRYHTDCELY